jgi:hypothetical protein
MLSLPCTTRTTWEQLVASLFAGLAPKTNAEGGVRYIAGRSIHILRLCPRTMRLTAASTFE